MLTLTGSAKQTNDNRAATPSGISPAIRFGVDDLSDVELVPDLHENHAQVHFGYAGERVCSIVIH